MKPTTFRLIATLFVIGFAAGWALTAIVGGWTGRALPIPVLAGAVLWLLAIALFVWSVVIKPRLATSARSAAQSNPLPPLIAARVAVVAMAAARMGSLVSGLYAGIAVVTLAGGLQTPAAEQLLWSALLACTGAAATCWAGIRLERWFLVPAGRDDEEQ